MATIALAAVGGFVGGTIGGTILGVTSAAIGQAIGAMIGNSIDQSLMMGNMKSFQEGPRLEQASVTTSTEGAPVTRLHGRMRLSGQLIWATRFEEQVVTTVQRQGGKGGGPKAFNTTYSYYANFAVAFCEGPITRFGRFWADGREIDQSTITVRTYLGTEDQLPDALIQAKEGAENVSAHRGYAYVVFERLPIDKYGRRIPQITAEVYRSVGKLENEVESVCVLPGATEFGYDTEEVTEEKGSQTLTLNRNTRIGSTNWRESIDQLQAVSPGLKRVMLPVAWFADDLRAGESTILPRVEASYRRTFRRPPSLTINPTFPVLGIGADSTYSWSVDGLVRGSVPVISTPKIGGTPSDVSIISAIIDLKSRGLEVVLCPYLIMDISDGNTLPDPYSANGVDPGQEAYAWRGKLTVHPAPGVAGTVDKTAMATTQINDFFTKANGYRRFVLHMAELAQAAGGVDAFLLGTDLRGLTIVRNELGQFPAISQLKALAGDVRAVVGASTQISYAADWTEYHSYRPEDGSGDVLFNMDDLWSDADIDFVGINNFMPASDWRDGYDHVDFNANGPAVAHDPDYLKSNIEGGEYYDWRYQSASDRALQQRTAINDPAYSKPWVFRQKDIRNWWANAHIDRPAGVEATGTTWTPGMKPIWFTALGCPAVDKGANQPDLHLKGLPYFSTGARDDAIQRAFMQAHHEYWKGDAMIGSIIAWAWDTRPAPSFPQEANIWADAMDWHRGHWLTGRLGAAPAEEVLADILERNSFTNYEIGPIGVSVDAVVTSRMVSARAMIESVSAVFNIVAFESGDKIVIRSRQGDPVRAVLPRGSLVRPEEAGSDAVRATRAQETDLPRDILVRWAEPTLDDRAAAAEAERDGTVSVGKIEVQFPVVMSSEMGESIAERLKREAWVGRETIELQLPPSQLALEPGDIIQIEGSIQKYRLNEVGDGMLRPANAVRVDPSAQVMLATAPEATFRSRTGGVSAQSGRTIFSFLDIPMLTAEDRPFAPYVAARMAPWRNGVAFWKSATTSGFTLDTQAEVQAGIGSLVQDFAAGPLWRWDMANELIIRMPDRALISLEDELVFAGANTLAIEQESGEWEILQYANADLIASNTYRLTRLLRGQKGSEHAMGTPVLADARVVMIDPAILQTGLTADQVGTSYNWRVGGAHLDVSDYTVQKVEFTSRGRGARPYAPVHLKGIKSGGNWGLSWIRRNRISADSWDLIEVPMSEDAESYQLEILDATGTTVLRTETVTQPEFTWTSAMQAADAGGAVSTFKIRVRQVSATIGPGIPATAQIGGS